MALTAADFELSLERSGGLAALRSEQEDPEDVASLFARWSLTPADHQTGLDMAEVRLLSLTRAEVWLHFLDQGRG